MPFSELTRLDDIRKKRPLLHCISNLVTANDCANLALAMGASPMMAEAPEEMAEIERLSDATVLNCGTPSAQKHAACLISGREAARLGKPVVLDPVGVGASAWRLENAGRLLTELALPDLSALSGGGYTYSWNVPSSVSGDFTLEAVRTPNVYSVRLVSEYELPDMEYAMYDGAYVYELSYTYGEKTELPCGASGRWSR